MNLLDLLQNLFTDYTLRTVALGAAVLGMTSGVLGAYAVLRRQSLLGDAISHAALPGVALAFLLTRSKAPLILLAGAAIAGWLATLWMMSIVRNTRIKQDSALALVLSVFFGLGMMLLTFTQRLPDARQAGLDSFLFGQAATLVENDVLHMAIIGGLALVVVALFWKEFKLLSFDKDFGVSLGFAMGPLDVLLTSLLVIAIVIGLQAVGVVLMSAMIVAPAAAARQWTDRLDHMALLSGLFGALAGVVGALISSSARGLSTGPTIVLCASLLVLVSLLFAPNRGLAARWIRERRSRRQLKLDAVLGDLLALANQHNDPLHAHSLEVISLMETQIAPAHKKQVRQSLNALRERGWVQQIDDEWALTPQGVRAAIETTPDGVPTDKEGQQS
jgi:manganese/zinc/iron transport system permease protein